MKYLRTYPLTTPKMQFSILASLVFIYIYFYFHSSPLQLFWSMLQTSYHLNHK